MTARRKRKHFVHDSFQFRFLIVSLLHYLMVIITFVGALFLPLMLQLDSFDLSLADRVNLANQFLSLHERVWPALLVAVLLLGVHILFFSHRIAGPLYRWRDIFRALGEGDFTVRATIRKGDYLQREVETLNGMIDAVRAKFEEVQRRHGRVRQASGELRQAIASGATGEVAPGVKRLEERLEELEKSLESFKTGQP